MKKSDVFINENAVPPKKTKLNHAITRSLMCSVFALPLLMPNTLAFAAEKVSKQSTKKVTIAAGELGTQINQLAANHNVIIYFDSALTNGLKSKKVHGDYSINMALTELLKGSGLKHIKENDGSYRVIRNTSKSAKVMTLETAQVRDNSKKSTTQGTGIYTTGSMSSATGLNISMRETPQSVSVLSSQLIEDQNIRNLTDVVDSAVGISSRALDSERQMYSARGFIIDSYQIDGNSITWSPAWSAGENQTDTAIFDRVEIVRGATGLMVGAGNPSAAINLVRKRALSEEFTGDLNISAGSWNTYRAMADIGSALNSSGTIRARVVASHEQGDSFVDLASHETTVLYGVLDADITDKTVISLGASYQDNTPQGTLWGGLPIWYADNTRTHYKRSKTKSAEWSSWQSTNVSYFAKLSHEITPDWQLTLDVNHIDNSADEKLIWVRGAPDKDTGEGMIAAPSYLRGERVQDDINLKLSGDYALFGNSHNASFGYSYSNQDQTSQSTDNNFIMPIPNFDLWNGDIDEPQWGEFKDPDKMNTEQQGFYGVTRLSLTNEIKVIVGGRYADWHQKGNNWSGDVSFGDTAFVPYAGALYDFNENHTLYLSFTDIFKPQNHQDYQGNYLEAIRGSNYELGFKSDFFDGDLTTSATLFKIDQDNVAQADVGRTIPGTTPPAQAYFAAQGTVSEGFEIEAVGKLLPNWDINFGYTQFDAEDADGEQVNTNQPRKLFKLFTKYNFTGSLAALSIGGGVNWQSDNFTVIAWGPYAGKKVSQEAYTLVNLMARYDISEQLTAQLNVDNLLDETYYSQIGFYSQYAYGQPRSFNLSLNYTF